MKLTVESYFKRFESQDKFSYGSNYDYFCALLDSFQNSKESELIIHQPEAGITSNIYPLAILDESEFPHVAQYNDLEPKEELLKNYNLVMCKMHAGLGSSVKRSEYLLEKTGRKNLGSKGTDLFIETNEGDKSLAELQLAQAKQIKAKNIFKNVFIQNLVNDETIAEVNNIDSSSYGVDLKANILQFKIPTLDESFEITDARVAPAGHAFVGFSLLSSIFTGEVKDELICIGNGEDLNSTADTKILSWVVENNIPLTMITTTKLAKDKKGGQISKVKTDEGDYITIIEKAQAEKANQLSYFEELGLRESDNYSLFNTNIVVINTKALKEKFNEHLDISKEDFLKVIVPDLIKNIKEQDGKKFTQLEGALGSSVLNLDKYFRLNFQTPLVSFLNLDPVAREKFFIPIKTMEDFEDLLTRYQYNSDSGRFDLKA